MISVPLSQLSSVSKNKTHGYMEEALRRGKIVSNWLEISEDDYDYIKNNFNFEQVVSKQYKPSTIVNKLPQVGVEPVLEVASFINKK